jgi:uncharacterized protein (TIRG00374 family)
MRARLASLFTARRLLAWLLIPALAWALLRRLPLGEVAAILANVQPWQVIALAAFNLGAMLVFSSRWWLILRALDRRLPYLAVFRYRTAAFAISYFTPGTQFGGEPLQVYSLQSRHALPAPLSVASVTLDKLFELLTNFTFLALGVLAVAYSQALSGLSTRQAALWTAGLALLPALYLLTVAAGGAPLSWLAAWLFPRLPARLAQNRILSRAPVFFSETEALVGGFLRRKPLALLGVALACAGIWSLSLLEYWLASYFLGARLTPLQAIAALTAARLAFLTPLPGGLGALEAGQMFVMQSLGYDPALGLAISLWIRVRDTGLGLFGLWLGLGLAGARSAVQPLPGEAGD